LKNAHLLRFPHPSPFNVPASTPHGLGFRGPCIWTFLNSLQKEPFSTSSLIAPAVLVSINKFLDNRTIVLYMRIMKEKRTIKTVQKIIAAFFRENRRMPSFAEMVGILDVKSKSVVHFWTSVVFKTILCYSSGWFCAGRLSIAGGRGSL
jgi:hypothetical protein